MQERDGWRSQCKAGGLALDRSREGSFLVTGERPDGQPSNGVSRLGGGASGGGRRWKFSSDCFYCLREIRTILIVIIRVKMGRGY